MTAPAMVERFPNIEDAFLEILSDLGTTVTAFSQNPHNEIRVLRVGGSSVGWEDRPIVEVTTLAVTRPDSVRLTNAIRERLNNLRNAATAAGLIDKIRENEGPVQIPDLNPDARQVPTYWRAAARLQLLPTLDQ